MARSADTALQLFVDRLVNRSVLTQEEQQAILDLPTRRMTVKARYDIIDENEVTSNSCLIVSGLVGRFGQLDRGVRQTTAFHVPGDMADLHSAVRPIGIGGLHALSDAIILKVPHKAIRGLVSRYPAVAEALWRNCMLDAAVLMQWVLNVGCRPAQTRLAHIFCEMAVRYGDDLNPTMSYDFPVTQEQLGEASALTGVHVNRSLKVLRNAELVSFDRGVVTIPDWTKITKAAEFDSRYLVGDTGPERQYRLLAA